jgi:hypothetical protein
MSERRKPEIDLKPLNELAKVIQDSFNQNVKPPPIPEIKKPQPRPSR